MQEKKENEKTLTRNDFAQLLYADVGAIGESYRFVAGFFDVLSEQIIEQGEVKIHGFGKFRCIKKAQRIGRNPKTGEEVPITARRVASFVAGGRFKRIMMLEDDSDK
ncbi:MAG: HU family DNA-binding protein [Proteobacteria bacterium]|nr:HU family DNA-binding protein [Pseudomonadota bacterium]MCH9758128.1 HU family DNA-binding protein [Pseudomonadota bacterium]